MCKCTPEIRTPYCGEGDCVWPHEKPDGIRSSEMSDKMPDEICSMCDGKETIPAPFSTERKCPECSIILTRSEYADLVTRPAQDTPASDVGEAHTHKDFIVMPRKGHSELHEAMADACIRSIPQLESIYDSLPKEAANDFALELWNYMEPIYAAAIKEVDELHGYKYYSALNYTQSPDVGQLLKALKAKVNDALSMAETLGFYGELEKKALVAEYLITAIAAAEKAQGE